MEGWTGIPVPILSVKGATYDTCQELLKLHGKISPEDYRKITVALDAFSEGVDKETLVNKIFNFRSDRVTPMMFEFNLAEQAQKHRMRIVLPEGEELRISCAPPSPCARRGDCGYHPAWRYRRHPGGRSRSLASSCRMPTITSPQPPRVSMPMPSSITKCARARALRWSRRRSVCRTRPTSAR